MLCPNCGAQNRDDFAFCVNCGTPLATYAQPMQPVQNTMPASSRSRFNLPLVIGLSLALVLAIGIGAFALVTRRPAANAKTASDQNKADPTLVLVAQNFVGSLYNNDLSKMKPQEIISYAPVVRQCIPYMRPGAPIYDRFVRTVSNTFIDNSAATKTDVKNCTRMLVEAPKVYRMEDGTYRVIVDWLKDLDLRNPDDLEKHLKDLNDSGQTNNGNNASDLPSYRIGEAGGAKNNTNTTETADKTDEVVEKADKTVEFGDKSSKTADKIDVAIEEHSKTDEVVEKGNKTSDKSDEAADKDGGTTNNASSTETVDNAGKTDDQGGKTTENVGETGTDTIDTTDSVDEASNTDLPTQETGNGGMPESATPGNATIEGATPEENTPEDTTTGTGSMANAESSQSERDATTDNQDVYRDVFDITFDNDGYVEDFENIANATQPSDSNYVSDPAAAPAEASGEFEAPASAAASNMVPTTPTTTKKRQTIG